MSLIRWDTDSIRSPPAPVKACSSVRTFIIAIYKGDPWHFPGLFHLGRKHLPVKEDIFGLLVPAKKLYDWTRLIKVEQRKLAGIG